ncbi:MAG: hypothetical protein JWO12_1745 [Frankiales bacterium]|nr:hypothetical protein [Frankiales bacterium]
MTAGWNLPDERVEEPVPAFAAGSPHQPLTRPRVLPSARLVPLRPLAIGELLDGAFRIVRQNPRQALGIAAGISAVVTVVNVLLVLTVRTSPSLDPRGLPDLGAQLSNSFVTSGPGYLVGFFGGLVLTGALVSIVGKAVLGQPIEPRELWNTIRSRLGALLGVALLTTLALVPFIAAVVLFVILSSGGSAGVALGLVVLLPAGAAASAYLYTRYSLASAVLVLEGSSVVPSLRRAAVLVRGSWWRTFFVLLLTLLIGAIFGAILGLPLGLIASVVGDPDSTGVRVAEQVLAGLGSVVISPFTSAVRALLYLDRRMRAEGLDISLAATAAGVA